MDDPTVEAEAHTHALTTLNRVDRLLRVHRALYSCLRRLSPLHAVSVLDLGTGGGGFLGHLRQQYEASPNQPLLVGLDRSSFALNKAKRWQDSGIQWLCGDAMRIPLADESVDVVSCSLFLHHFSEAGAADVLREAVRVARRGVIVGDLSRSRLAWIVTWVGTRLLSRSRLFHVDGPRSVRAAYRAEELADIARRAGLVGADVVSQFPFRLLLTWRKEAQPSGMP